MRETRTVNYVTEEDVAHMKSFVAYKVLECSAMDPNCFQSTFKRLRALEYRHGMITVYPYIDKVTEDPTRHGLPVHEVFTTSKNLLLGLVKRIDRLVLYKCTAYHTLDYLPKDARTFRGYTDGLALAVRLDEMLFTFEEATRKYRPDLWAKFFGKGGEQDVEDL